MIRRAACLLTLLTIAGVSAATGSAQTDRVSALLEDPSVASAQAAVRAGEARVIQDQVEWTAIPAPPFDERARGLTVEQRLSELDLHKVRIDKAGNVIGERPGRSARPNVVLAAHLDTVFPKGTDVGVKREGSLLRAPGVGDNGRGLAVMPSVPAITIGGGKGSGAHSPDESFDTMGCWQRTDRALLLIVALAGR